MPELLVLFKDRNNEQDPVRSALLQDLVQLPPVIWRVEHLADLAQIIRAALDAIDISHVTIATLYQLVIRILPRHPNWSAKQLAILAQKFGFIHAGYHLDHNISDADLQHIAPALLSVLENWMAHENEYALQITAQRFGKRLRVFEDLILVVELMLTSTRSSQFADAVLPLLMKHRPDRTAQLIPDLLQNDPSWIIRPVIHTFLHRRRQDLLTPFLGQHAYSGRFSTGKTRFMLSSLQEGFMCWTRRQQAIFATTLVEVINDNTLSQGTMLNALKQLARLPALPATSLIAFANEERPFIRDTTLLLLSHLDSGQGIPTLIDALNDERARVAIYALRSFCKGAPIQQVLAILRKTPFTKITVAKEVVRLLGELPDEEAYQELLALDNQELHHDIRVAFLRVLWNHLDREETWQILERHALSPNMTIALGTVRMSVAPDKRQANQVVRRNYGNRYSWQRSPSSINADTSSVPLYTLPPQDLQRLMHLFALLLDHPEIEVRSAILRGCTRIAASDRDNELLSHLLEAMTSKNKDIREKAASAVFKTCEASDAQFIGNCFQRLLVNRHALYTGMQALQQALTRNRRELIPIIRTVLTVLTADPLTINQTVELAIVGLPWQEVEAFLVQAAATETLHAIALGRASQKLQSVANRADIAAIDQLETALATSTDERLRYLAFAALLAQTQLAQGWTDEARRRLRTYQADASPLVAATAQFTFPDDEGE